MFAVYLGPRLNARFAIGRRAQSTRVPRPLHFPLVDQLDRRFEERAYKLALFQLLIEYYEEYTRDGLDSQVSTYDDRGIYTESAEAKTVEEWFDEHYDVLGADDGTRLKTSDIHKTLAENGYKGSSKSVGQWMRRYFKITPVSRNQWQFGHASVHLVNRSNTPHWVCIAPKS